MHGMYLSHVLQCIKYQTNGFNSPHVQHFRATVNDYYSGNQGCVLMAPKQALSHTSLASQDVWKSRVCSSNVRSPVYCEGDFCQRRNYFWWRNFNPNVKLPHADFDGNWYVSLIYVYVHIKSKLYNMCKNLLNIEH